MTAAAPRRPLDIEDLETEWIDPGKVTLVRLSRYPDGEWKPPPPRYRTLRVDPPAGHKNRYAVLYTATTLVCIGLECHVLAVDYHDAWTLHTTREAEHRLARYSFAKAGLFIPIDGPRNQRLLFGEPPLSGYGPYQAVGLELYERFGHVAHGLSWASFHRHQLGRVYAIWHRRKADLGLAVRSTVELRSDLAWQGLVARLNPLMRISS
jgi:hypothetical protein